jgi:hypothetical protein
MHWLLSLIMAIAVIAIGISRKLNLGLVMLAGGITLLLTGGKAALLPEVVLITVRERSSQILLISIIFLELVGYLLKETGSLQKIINYLGRVVSDRRLLSAILPAIISVLALPGGAVFSAPLVEQAGEQAGLDAVRQAAVNLWFRHVIYFAFPFYPPLILAAGLTGISIFTISGYNLPLTAAAFFIAYPLLFRGIDRQKTSTDLPAAGTANHNRIHKGFFKLVLAGIRFKLALTVLGIMFFKQALLCSETTVSLSEAVLNAGVPLSLLMLLFPAFIGLLSGDNTTAVAISFPLFLPLLDPGLSLYPAQIAFIYFSATWGHIFTPVHPCFAMTNAYFNVTAGRVLRPLLIPAGAVLVASWLLFFLENLIFL